ncbi:NAD(P)-binding protein [Sporormia fimetaria CBS 119925]|uniref:NAD(P)-binding protein n=1 Tax=Sporormia fimetaria CBS 119925 TaxID=1340428 RepID=A0A6A6VKT3_9PLEO|nr:NAD(P)-binding protein [Sporormia fimetaria CBS 119925]
MSLPKVLVTGGSGFLGSHVVDAFVATGRFQVISISRKPTVNCNPKAKYLACDVTDHNSIAALIEDVAPDIIVHTVTPGPFAPAKAHRKDYEATKNLLQLSKESTSVKAFVYSGSINPIVNTSGARKAPLSESEVILHDAKTAGSAYAQFKAFSILEVLKANGNALRTTVLYLPALYGPRDKTGTLGLADMGKTPMMTRFQFGSNSVLHEWLFGDNAAHAHILAAQSLLNNTETRQIGGEAFFITDGEPMKFWDFTRAIWTGLELNIAAKPIVIPWWVMIAMAAVFERIFGILTLGQKPAPFSRHHLWYMKEGAWLSIEKAEKMLGYAPLVRTQDGIDKAVCWVRESRGAAQQAASVTKSQ